MDSHIDRRDTTLKFTDKSVLLFLGSHISLMSRMSCRLNDSPSLQRLVHHFSISKVKKNLRYLPFPIITPVSMMTPRTTYDDQFARPSKVRCLVSVLASVSVFLHLLHFPAPLLSRFFNELNEPNGVPLLLLVRLCQILTFSFLFFLLFLFLLSSHVVWLTCWETRQERKRKLRLVEEREVINWPINMEKEERGPCRESTSGKKKESCTPAKGLCLSGECSWERKLSAFSASPRFFSFPLLTSSLSFVCCVQFLPSSQNSNERRKLKIKLSETRRFLSSSSCAGKSVSEPLMSGERKKRTLLHLSFYLSPPLLLSYP